MKQKKFGQKIQNWHRPLGPNELKARIRRYREQGERGDRLYPFYGWWDEVDGWDEDYYWFEDGRQYDDFRDVWRAQLVQQVLNPHCPLRALEAALPQRADGEMLSDVPVFDLRGSSEIAFAVRLNQHVQRIQAYDAGDTGLGETIRVAIGGSKNVEIVATYAPEYANTLCLFAPFWCRTPASWNPELGVSLQEHLFVRYPVPTFLRLEKDCRYVDDKWVCWLILLGCGESLKNAAEVFGWDIPGRLPAFLSKVPADLDPIEGCLYAEVQRLGGNETDYRRILADPSFVFDITDLHYSDDEVDFWRESVSWLIRNRDQMSDEESVLSLAWGRHRYTEAQRGHREWFSWKGRSLRAVLEQSRAYREECYRYGGYRSATYTWLAHGWDWTPDVEALQGWSVVELTTTKQLVEEGQAMHHCVGGYGWRCDQGISAIVSVRYQGERRVTIEVEPKTGRIIQVRGSYNREADRDEVYVTAIWHKRVVLPTVTTSAPQVAEALSLEEAVVLP